jgi:hypothetical protein
VGFRPSWAPTFGGEKNKGNVIMSNIQLITEIEINGENVYKMHEIVGEEFDFCVSDAIFGCEQWDSSDYLEKLGISISFTNGGWAEKNNILLRLLISEIVFETDSLKMSIEESLTNVYGFSHDEIAEKYRNYINNNPNIVEALRKYLNEQS